jgi:hypothetical protein
MKTNPSMKLLGLLFVSGLLIMSGCYTVLMHPSMLTSSEGESTPQAAPQGDFTSEISYNQNCLNCHSQAELDDRYYDMGQAGMHYAHGMSIDPYGWQRPATSLPWWDGVLAPTPSTAASSASSTTESGPRRRSSGVTRGGDTPRVSTTQSDPATTSTTTSTAPATSPAVSDSRSSTPTSTQSTSTDRTRSTSAPAKEAPPRKAGSTRGDDPK